MSEDSLFENQKFTDLARSYEDDSWWPEMQQIKSFSMLHFETLYLLRHFAAQAKGAIVEVGAYQGGSTIALARGAKSGCGGPLVTFEIGGAYPTHPHCPTDDILGDLRKHIKQFGVDDIVTIIDAPTADLSRRDEFERSLRGKKIDMVFIDADGQVGLDLDHLKDWLSETVLLVLDDFFAPGAPDKANLVSDWVNQALAVGTCENLGLYRWGTWFGLYRPSAR